MFTGIVEAIGRVVDISGNRDRSRLRLEMRFADELKDGDSIAVNGVCLTATAIDGSVVTFDVGPETARLTNLSALAAGAPVNLERPMRLNGRVDGHLVLGHVDGTGRVQHIRAEAESYWLTIAFPSALAAYFIHKGSVAVDGVSLTVAALRGHDFDVQIVPYTWTHTTLSARAVGDTVNLECDMIGKYVVRALQLTQARDHAGASPLQGDAARLE